MSHPLDGCFARLDRAETHLQCLHDALAELEPNTITPPLQVKVDLNAGRIAVICADDVYLPLPIGVIFGDLVHSLHAVLDNLVFALGCLDGKKPGRESQFPIVNEPNEWFTPDVRDMLTYVRPQDRARIESHQPFMRRNDIPPKDNVLARLKRYSNEGKHRVVTPIGGVSTGAIVSHVETNDLEITSSDLDIRKALRKDAVVARFGCGTAGPNPSVRMEGRLPWYPALDDGDPAEDFARLAFQYVHDLLIEFRDASF